LNKLMVAVYIALLVCPFISIGITVPIVYYSYIKTKVINVIRCINIYLLLFFTLCAYFLTLLPFPTLEQVAGMTSSYIQLIPFYCIYDFVVNSGLVISDWKTVLPALGGGIMIGIVCNIIMLMPSGFFFKRVFNKANFSMVFLTGLLISMFFELTQLTGVFFIYSRPYRIFDVDDLIQNTFGFVIGAQLSYVWRFFKEPTHLYVRQGGEVSFRRRFSAGCIDQGIIGSIIALTVLFTKLNVEFFATHPFKSFPIYFAFMIILNVVLAIIMYITDGVTLGMYVFGLRLKDVRGRKVALWQCIVRNVLLGIFQSLPFLIGWFITLSVNRNIILSILFTMLSAELVISYVLFLLTLSLHIVTHGEKLIYEVASKTHLGLESETAIKNRQKVLYRGNLTRDKIGLATKTIYEILLDDDINNKDCIKMSNMAAAALITWLENGLEGHVFTVQIDERWVSKTLLICIHGKYIKVDNIENIVLETVNGKILSYDTYYTGGINVFAIEI